jgi:hypothetical protein
MIHLRPTNDPAADAQALLSAQAGTASRAALRWLDARALLFGVLATMGSLLSIALGNDLALGAGIVAVAGAFAATTAIGACSAAAAARIAGVLSAKAGLPPAGRIAARYALSVWVALLLATTVVLRAVFTDGIERWTVVAALAGFVLVAAVGIAMADVSRRRRS